MLEFTLKDGTKVILSKDHNELRVQLFTENNIEMGYIDWDINKVVDMLFTE